VPEQEPDYFSHAFWSQYNLIGLGTALGFAILSASALPLVLVAGVEMVVLPLVTGSERFRRLVRARVSEEQREQVQAKRQLENSEMIRSLSGDERARYRALESMAAEIRQNYRGLDESSRMLLDDLVKKLDFLLSFHLRMRYALSRYDAYFATTDPERIQERLAMLEHEIEKGPERVREIKQKTKVVLEKRLERWAKAQENRQLMDAQTETVQEVLQLLRDQSYSMKDPKTITEQLDGLVSAAEETERGVRDMEELLSTDGDSLLPGSLDGDIEAELQRGRESAPAEPARPPQRTAGALPRIAPPAPPKQPVSPPPPPRRKLTN
jgi:DNA repair exonuclease SbcCD ATPase subunit